MKIRELRVHAAGAPRIYRTHVAASGGSADGKVGSLCYMLEVAGAGGPGKISDMEHIWKRRCRSRVHPGVGLPAHYAAQT